jgi:hypothetical protein
MMMTPMMTAAMTIRRGVPREALLHYIRTNLESTAVRLTLQDHRKS